MKLIKHFQEKGLLTNLSAAIKANNEFDLALINKFELSTELRKYKTDKGGVNYPALFSIPKEERISAMAKIDFIGTTQVLSVAIKVSLDSVNLKRPLTNSQIFDLVETIIDESESDNLSLEDVLLFLQQFIRGEYGDMYESMDVPKFMVKFNKYRDDRWDAGIKIRTEKEIEFKTLGDQERSSQPNPLADQMIDFAGRIGELKEKLKDKTEQLNQYRDKQ